jgi:cytochrome d ubiquinol oxidase subunit II
MPAVGLSVLLAIGNYVFVDIEKLGINPGVAPIGAAAALLSVGYFLRNKQYGWSFIMIALTMVLALATFFWFLYPNVMVSSTDEAFNLTVDTASSSGYTLKVMTIVALFFVPIVLVYQGWTYWTFRKRLLDDTKALEY